MPFDPNSAKPIAGFDPSSAKPVRPKQAGPELSATESALRGFSQGLTFNFGDELAAAGQMSEERDLPLSQQTITSPEQAIQRYNETLQTVRQGNQAAREQHPVANVAGNLAGSLITAPALGPLAGSPQTVAQAIGSGARVGAASGLITGFGEGENLKERGLRALTGSALGGVIGGITGGLSSLFAKPSVPAPAPEVIKAQSQAAYKAMDDAGVVLTQPAASKLSEQVRAAVKSAGYDPDVYPSTESAIRSLEKLQKEPAFGFSQLDLKRQLLRDVLMGSDAKERRVATIAIQALDKFAKNLGPEDVAAGDAKTATDAITLGRQLWGRYSKSQTIQDIFDMADATGGQFSVSGKENAIRTGFRGLYKSLVRDKAEQALYSDAELAAIKKVATGGPIENSLRLMGKMAVRGPVSAAPTAMGWAFGGPVGAATVAGLGEAGRFGAATATQSNARLAADLIARGGPSALNLGPAPGLEAALAAQPVEVRKKFAELLGRRVP